MTQFICKESNQSPTWGLVDLFAWKLLPQKLGGGTAYIRKFKDAWVQHNKDTINSSAGRLNIPPELLAGVCWIEVGGDPNFIDRVAFEVRTFDWSGPEWVDRNFTVTNEPAKTSFGPVSIQLRTAAQTLGLSIAEMSTTELRSLANCLQQDVYNIELVARHLRDLIDRDAPRDSSLLTMEQIKIVGARYNRGIDLPIHEIRKNTSYGDLIVKLWPHLTSLLR